MMTIQNSFGLESDVTNPVFVVAVLVTQAMNQDYSMKIHYNNVNVAQQSEDDPKENCSNKEAGFWRKKMFHKILSKISYVKVILK